MFRCVGGSDMTVENICYGIVHPFDNSMFTPKEKPYLHTSEQKD